MAGAGFLHATSATQISRLDARTIDLEYHDRMRTTGSVLAVILCSGAAIADDKATGAVPQKLNLDVGRWKITRLISLGSKHELTKPAPTSECLTLAAPLPAAETGWPAGTTCTSEQLQNGSTVNWTFTCSLGSTTTTGTGTLSYTGKKLAGTLDVEAVTGEGGGMSGRRGVLKISGVYVGACPATPGTK